jgi:hypothetical protein
VQQVNEYIADGKNQNANRFLRNDTQTDTCIAAKLRRTEVNFSDVEELLAARPEPASLAPWDALHQRTRQERLMVAVRLFNNVFIPYLELLVCMRDEDGNAMPTSEVVKEIMEAAFRVPLKGRVAPTLIQCLPQSTVERLKTEGRAELIVEQRRHAQVDNVDKWQLGTCNMTAAQVRIVRGLVPPHTMPSMHLLASNRIAMARKCGDLISFMKTHSGYQVGIRSMMMIQILSNMLGFCCSEYSVLRDQLYVHNKLLIDGFNCQQIHAGKLVAVHNGMGFLPRNEGVQMTDLCHTDEEMRNSNPACKGGKSTTTLCVFLGKETFANMRANLTTEGPEEESDLLALEPLLKPGAVPGLTVARMQHLCSLYYISSAGNR